MEIKKIAEQSGRTDTWKQREASLSAEAEHLLVGLWTEGPGCSRAAEHPARAPETADVRLEAARKGGKEEKPRFS